MPNMLRCNPVLGVLLGALGLSSACDSSLVSPNPDPTELVMPTCGGVAAEVLTGNITKLSLIHI